jgi:hypothetical protein
MHRETGKKGCRYEWSHLVSPSLGLSLFVCGLGQKSRILLWFGPEVEYIPGLCLLGPDVGLLGLDFL